MMYDSIPLYPGLAGMREPDACVRVPMFDGCRRPPACLDDVCQCRRVTFENPCRPGERVEVALGVDSCGSLVVCVHRESCGCRPRPPRPCSPIDPCPPPPACAPPRPCLPPPPPRGCCEHGRGRLYGSWRR